MGDDHTLGADDRLRGVVLSKEGERLLKHLMQL